MPLEKFIEDIGWRICFFCKHFKHCYSLPLLTPVPLCKACIDKEPISNPNFCPGFFTYLQSLTPLSAITNNAEEDSRKMCRLCYVAKGTVIVSDWDNLHPTPDLYNDKMVKLEPGDFLCSNCFRIRGSREMEEAPIMDVEPAAAVAEPNEGDIDFSLPAPQQPCRKFSKSSVPCFYCGLDANGKPKLMKRQSIPYHFYTRHKFEDAYKCLNRAMCSIYFGTLEERKEHTKLHFEKYLQRQFQCFSYCDIRFDYIWELNSHQMKMHKEQFKCSQCDRKFVNEEKVRKHKLISGHESK